MATVVSNWVALLVYLQRVGEMAPIVSNWLWMYLKRVGKSEAVISNWVALSVYL